MDSSFYHWNKQNICIVIGNHYTYEFNEAEQIIVGNNLPI